MLSVCRALFPPGTDKSVLQPRGEGIEREAANWFHNVYPRTQQPHWAAPRPIDVIQVNSRALEYSDEDHIPLLLITPVHLEQATLAMVYLSKPR